jgi:meso-butanediol dehydrogenase / (S,S)-butanediol dehydrogenase / diacetyl reductase
MRLENKVALITGGGTGVGAAVARMFTREGAKVVVTGRRPEPIEAIAREVGGVAVAGDTSDRAHAHEAVAAAVDTFGGLDVVVASAGMGIEGTVGDIEDEQWQRTLDVNLTGPMMIARAALPAMIARGGGSVVLVSSTNSFGAAPASVAYDASKAALNALARGIAVDYGPQGIRANALCPGWIITPMGDESMDDLAAAHGTDRQGAYDLATADVPLRHAGTADEMAACCLFLASDESSIVSGTTLIADGGAMAVELTSRMFASGS